MSTKEIKDYVSKNFSTNSVTKKIERVAAYIRVSHQEQKLHGISLDAQKDKLKEYAEKHGLKIVEWYMDEGVSGRKLIKRRPELQRMIHDAEAGKFDRIIFIKLDRFFRSIAEYHECMKIIEPVLWTATEEEYDLTTANGRMLVNMKLTIAELEADQTGERINLVNEYKVKTGQPLSGVYSFCWIVGKDGDRKRVKKNPETAHIMEDLLQHIWTHQSKHAAVVYINKKYDMDISYDSVSKLLRNTMLYGEYRGNPDYLLPEDRYMTKEDFDKMQGFLRRQVKSNGAKYEYLFKGLLVCPECGKLLKGATDNRGKKPLKRYRCQKNSLRGTCDFKKVVSERTVEKLLLANIEQYFEDAKAREAAIIDSNPMNNEIELAELQAELDRLNYAWQKGRIKDAVKYDKDYDELVAKIEAAQAKHIGIVKKDFSKVEEALSGDWRTIYNALDEPHKRAFWRSFVESIELDWCNGTKRSDKKISRVKFF